MVTIILLSADNADTSEEQLEEWKTSIKENHALPGEYASLPVDYLIGNVAFTFEETILDDAVYEEFSKAYEELLAAMNVTPEEYQKLMQLIARSSNQPVKERKQNQLSGTYTVVNRNPDREDRNGRDKKAH